MYIGNVYSLHSEAAGQTLDTSMQFGEGMSLPAAHMLIWVIA